MASLNPFAPEIPAKHLANSLAGSLITVDMQSTLCRLGCQGGPNLRESCTRRPACFLPNHLPPRKASLKTDLIKCFGKDLDIPRH